MCTGSNFWVDFIAPVVVIGVDVDFKAFNGLTLGWVPTEVTPSLTPL